MIIAYNVLLVMIVMYNCFLDSFVVWFVWFMVIM